MRDCSRKLLWGVVFLLFPLVLSAQADITLTLKKGGSSSYNIESSGYLLFNKDTMKIKTSNQQQDLMLIPLSMIKTMQIFSPIYTTGDTDSSLSSLSRLDAYPNPVLSKFYLSGVNVGDRVQLFSLTGVLLDEFAYSDEGIDLSGYSVGNYVVKVNGVSIKISKL